MPFEPKTLVVDGQVIIDKEVFGGLMSFLHGLERDIIDIREKLSRVAEDVDDLKHAQIPDHDQPAG